MNASLRFKVWGENGSWRLFTAEAMSPIWVIAQQRNKLYNRWNIQLINIQDINAKANR